MSYFKSTFLTNSADTQINTVLDTEGYLNLSTSMLQNVVTSNLSNLTVIYE